MKNLVMAILDFKIAVQLNPRDKDGRVRLIRALFDSGKFDEAIKG